MDATLVRIEQPKKSVRVDPCAARVPEGARPSAASSSHRDWTCVLGAITEAGDRFASRFDEYVPAEYAKHVVLRREKRSKRT
jgi:hypothetical protein